MRLWMLLGMSGRLLLRVGGADRYRYRYHGVGWGGVGRGGKGVVKEW